MGKKSRSRNANKTYVSKGERRVNRKVTKSLRADRKADYLNVMNNKIDAWRAGKKVMLTIENPNKEETNRPFIRLSATSVWGSPKDPGNQYRLGSTT